MAESDAFEFPHSVYVEFEFFRYTTLTRDALDQLFSSGGVDETQAELLRKELEAGGVPQRQRLWYADEHHWRVSTDFPLQHGHMRYVDAARDGAVMWAMTPAVLHATEDGVTPPGNATRSWIQPEDLMSGIQQVAHTFVFGLNAPPTRYGPVLSSRATTNGMYEIRAGHSYDPVDYVRIEATPNDMNGVDIWSMDVVRKDPPASSTPPVGSRLEYAGWDDNAAIGRRVAAEKRTYAGDRLYSTVTRVSFRALDEGELDSLMQLPMPETPDAIRGMPTYASMYDHTTREQVFYENQPGERTRGQIEAKQPFGRPTTRSSTGYLFNAVYIVSAGLIVGGVLMHILRRKQ